jgi:hypothetical protein
MLSSSSNCHHSIQTHPQPQLEALWAEDTTSSKTGSNGAPGACDTQISKQFLFRFHYPFTICSCLVLCYAWGCSRHCSELPHIEPCQLHAGKAVIATTPANGERCQTQLEPTLLTTILCNESKSQALNRTSHRMAFSCRQDDPRWAGPEFWACSARCQRQARQACRNLEQCVWHLAHEKTALQASFAHDTNISGTCGWPPELQWAEIRITFRLRGE